MTSIEFAEHSKRLRAAHYGVEARRFRHMAETEPIRSVRRHLQAIASEYEHMAAVCVKRAKLSLPHAEKRLPIGQSMAFITGLSVLSWSIVILFALGVRAIF